jgi:hypothetical protein
LSEHFVTTSPDVYFSNKIKEIREDIYAASTLSDYEAVEVLWVALVKAANLMAGNNEHRRIIRLIQTIPASALSQILSNSAIDRLINIKPPLETILADEHERLYPDMTREAITRVKSLRQKKPQQALLSLGEILKRIRNKRAHGFKTRSGPRDMEILSSARILLAQLCQVVVDAFSENRKPKTEN